MVKLKTPIIIFFTCTKYSALRNDILNEIFRIENLNIVNTHVLLWGDCSIGIIDIITTIPTNKTIGPDNISHKMLKNTVSTIVKPLCLLFNRSLRDCLFPDSWKIANVLPLFKKGDPSELSNYRPVSLLSCVGKIMERIVFKYLYNYFHSNNLLYKYQADFYLATPQYINSLKLMIVF